MKSQTGARFIARERKALEPTKARIDEFGLIQGKNSELTKISDKVVKRRGYVQR